MKIRFHQNRSFQITGALIVISAAICVGLVAFMVRPDWSRFQVENIEEFALFGAVLLLPALPGMFGLYLFFRFSGHVTLTDQEVIVHQFWRKNSVAYSEIIEVLEKDRRIPPNLVLITSEGKVRIPRLIERFFEFYKMLRVRTPVIRQREQQVHLPWRLAIGGNRLILNTIVFVCTSGILIFLVLIGTNDLATIQSLGIALLTISPLVAAYLFWLFIDEPIEVLFGDSVIEAHYLFKRTKTWSVSQLCQVKFVRERKQESTAVYATAQIMLRFLGGEKITIGTSRAWEFGCSPERLYFTLKHLYHKQSIET
jgi:hypothetical protein